MHPKTSANKHTPAVRPLQGSGPPPLLLLPLMVAAPAAAQQLAPAPHRSELLRSYNA